MLDQFTIAARVGRFQTHHVRRAERANQCFEIAIVECHHVVYHAQRRRHFRARALAQERLVPWQHRRQQCAGAGALPDGFQLANMRGARQIEITGHHHQPRHV